MPNEMPNGEMPNDEIPNERGERRRFVRSRVHVWACVSPDSGPAWEGVVLDVGWGGLHVAAPEPPMFEGGCAVRLYLGEDRMGPSISLLGEGIRRVDEGYVIRIVSVHPADIHHLKNLIMYNAEDPDEAWQQIANDLRSRFAD